MKSHNRSGSVLLLCASFIWGVAFVSTRYLGSQGFGVFFEILIRYFTPFLIFGLFYFKEIIKTPFRTIKVAILTGLILFITIILSIYGIRMVAKGSMGLLFLSLYVIFVPITTLLLKKENLSPMLISAACISFLGTILLRMEQAPGETNIGIMLCFLASIGYTVYIILCSKVLGNEVSAPILQFFQSVIFLSLTIPIFFLLEFPKMPPIDFTNYKLLSAILYKGIFSGTLAYLCYFNGQKLVSPTRTAVILAMQSVFGALADYTIFRINLSFISILGYILIISATFMVSININKKTNIKFQKQ